MRWNTLARRIADNIKRLRLERKLTQEAAAELSGSLSLRHWQYMESGEVNCTIKSLTKVARALKIDPQELFYK